MSITPPSLVKDPDATLDYAFDWSSWIGDSETVTDHEILIDDDSATPVTVDAAAGGSTVVSGVVTVWLSGGTDGADVEVTCRVTTSQGRTDDRTLTLYVRER